ncbi:MAG: hypothetical protein IJ736_11535 [Firmicutes bacterium]|nr:hypothetical protein [Bacillota bacterium]
MFKILESQNIEAEILEHSANVFHEAMKKGREHYHIKCESGDYDLKLIENDSLINYNFQKKAKVSKILPLYHSYDETDTKSLYLEFFDLYKSICIEEADEYTVVISKLALKHTDIEIYCLDERVEKFVGKNERLHIVDVFPDLPEKTYLTIPSKPPEKFKGLVRYVFMSAIAFHNIFFLQDLLNSKNIEDIKYLEYVVEQRSGIASIIMRLTAFKNAFARLGIKAGIKRGSGRYKTEMIERYFNIDFLGEDAVEENTIHIDSVAMLVVTTFYMTADKSYGKDILKKNLREEMDEYFGALFGGKKVLGLLIRGTDYHTTAQMGERIMAGVEDMIPMIDRWLEEDKYDNIFLASEDADICEKMVEKYGGRLRMLSQERHRVSDFKDVTLISELEKKEKSGKEYDDSLEDTTINYFYALYILSRCSSFMCSGQCNGYDMVCSFNGGKFERLYKFCIG